MARDSDSSEETITSDSDTQSDDDRVDRSDPQRLSAATVQMTRSALLNIIRNGVSYPMPSREDCGIRNLTLEEQNAKEMMFRFRVRINQRKKSNLSRTFRGPYKARRSFRAKIGSQLLPDEYIGQLKLKSRVFSSLWTPNGKYLISATQDHLVRVLRADAIDSKATNGPSIIQNRISIGQEGWSILDLALSPDSSQGAIVAWGDVIHLFSINDKDRKDTIKVPLPEAMIRNLNHNAIFSCQYDPTGNDRLIGGSRRGLLVLFDLNRQTSNYHIGNRKGEDINAVRYAHQNPNLIFSGGDDGIVTTWDLRTFGNHADSPVGFLAGHTEGIAYIDACSDGYTVLTNSKDQTIKLWDVRNFSEETMAIKVQETICDDPNRCDYRYEDPRMLANLDYRQQIIKRNSDDTSAMTLAGHQVSTTLMRTRFSPDYTGNRFIYTASADGCYAWDVLTGKLTFKNTHHHLKLVRDVDWHPHRPLLATSSWDEHVAFWRASTFSDNL